MNKIIQFPIDHTLDLHRATMQDEQGRHFRITKQRMPHEKFSDSFTIFFTRALEKLSITEFSPTTYRLFFHLTTKLDFIAWRPISQDDISDFFGCGQSIISKSLRALVAADFIEMTGTRKMRKYRMNSDHGFRGGAAKWHMHQRKKKQPELDI